MGVVVMEPLKGGKLATGIPDDLRQFFATADPDRTPAEWALRYVWNDPGVSLLLSGMNSAEQLAENLAVAERALPESLPAEDVEIYGRARELMTAKIKADCTACGYCQPCPSGVDIPKVIASLNKAVVWDDPNQWTTGYLRVEGKASACTECGQSWLRADDDRWRADQFPAGSTRPGTRKGRDGRSRRAAAHKAAPRNSQGSSSGSPRRQESS
jgi:predicted aldo/keto reductase-like oxidoreductase